MDFKQAEERFKDLKSKFEAGSLSENDFKSQLGELMVQDEGGNWWMIGYETEQWYRYDGKVWIQSDPQGSQFQKPKITRLKTNTSVPEMKPEEQRSLWKFGKKEIIQSLIGLVLFILLYFLFRGMYEFRYWSPAYAMPLFFGLTFGPIVGAVVGLLSSISIQFISGIPVEYFFEYFYGGALFASAIRGLIMGLARVPIDKFRSRNGIFRTELFVVISILGSTILYTRWSSIIPFFVESLFPQLLGNLVIIPISMVVYSFILARIKSRKK